MNREEVQKMTDLLPCPFCGDIPDLPDGFGTQYEIWCDGCGQAGSSVQISDLMTMDERMAEHAITVGNLRYSERYVERAKDRAIERWNTRYLFNKASRKLY